MTLIPLLTLDTLHCLTYYLNHLDCNSLMNSTPTKLPALALLCVVLVILFALVNKHHCYTMCYSKLLNINDHISLNDQLSIDGLNDHCHYVEPSMIKQIHNKNTDLGVIQLNIRGLLNKQTQIKQLLSSDNVSLPIDVILLCEKWLKPATLDLFDLPGYKSFHKIRRDHIGGGTSILVNDRLQS